MARASVLSDKTTAGCECAAYGHLELDRESINQRIRDTPSIKQRLDAIAHHSAGGAALLRCRACGQLWQSSRAWNWGSKEYVFKVPDIPAGEWLRQPYVQPDSLLIYAAVMADFLECNDFAASAGQCRVEGCQNNAIEGVGACLEHHIAALQDIGALPTLPRGRRFAPYATPERAEPA